MYEHGHAPLNMHTHDHILRLIHPVSALIEIIVNYISSGGNKNRGKHSKAKLPSRQLQLKVVDFHSGLEHKIPHEPHSKSYDSEIERPRKANEL
jgi:hypothetical protein